MIEIKCGTADVEFPNMYIPPDSSCEPRYLPGKSNNRLVLENFNTHYELWHSVLDKDPTRIRGQFYSWPDLKIVPPDVTNDDLATRNFS